ncbi:MAG: glycosyltransferase family 4 protein [Hyphomonadaceae bacterium]
MALKGATILQVIPHLGAGGAERTTIEVAEALVAAGAVPLVASVGGRMEGELTRVGGELIRIDALASKNPLTVWLNASVLARIARERNVKLIHARSRAPGWSAYWAAKRIKLPFVTTYHGVYNAKSGLKRWYNSVMARGDKVIANSDYTAAHVRKEHPEAASRIITIHRGVDTSRFAQDAVSDLRRHALRKAWRLDQKDGAVIMLPARLTGWKGHREAIKAAALLTKQTDQPWTMLFVGDHQGRLDYVGEIEEMISANALDGRVRRVGHCDDMPAAFSLADIVIAPSNEPEAFGRVAAEAGALGLPSVGSSIGAQREIIVDGETGLIVPPRDPEALAAAMARLLAMGEAGRREMGAKALVRVTQRFTTSALQKATLAVYEGLMDQSP